MRDVHAGRYLASFLLSACTNLGAAELTGSVALEMRGFAHAPSHSGQREHSGSVSIEPEFYHAWSNNRHSIVVAPFARLDSADDTRTHVDLREGFYQFVSESLELRIGLARVFWGVAESRHLVDVINQSDSVAHLDGEDKLGQPMVNLSLARAWGTIDLFALPYFRERTFPGRAGRLRTAVHVDHSLVRFESGAQQRRLDWAIRYAHSLGAFDIGLSHFWGTSREPRLSLTRTSGGDLVLAPNYDVVNQTGLDLQFTHDSWLWKLEAIHHSGGQQTFNALVGGFEYTFIGVAQSTADVGVLVEYLYDDRHHNTPHPFERDLFIGARLALNDAASSQLLAGIIYDLGGAATVFSAEASRRLAHDWTLAVEMRAWGQVSRGDPQHAVRRDDHIQFTVQRYF
jgi:hypothetical protein